MPGIRMNSITHPTFSPNGRWYAYSPLDTTLRIVDLHSPETMTVLEGNKAAIKDLNFSADSRTIAAGDRSGIVRLWDVATLRELANFPLDRWCGFSPDGRCLVGGTTELSVRRLREKE